MAKKPEQTAGGARFAALYDQLHAMAARELAGQRSDHTLQPTALVHEAWLRLQHGPTTLSGQERRQFFAHAGKAMRHVLVDHARRRQAQKRGGGGDAPAAVLALSDPPAPSAMTAALDAIALDEALRNLEHTDPDLVPLAELRLYAGLSLAQAADALEWPLSTAKNRWNYTVAVLSKALRTEV